MRWHGRCVSPPLLLTLQTACAELPETHPLREAWADLASHARTSGTTDGYLLLLKRFDAFSAPPELDESTTNDRESAIFSTPISNTGRTTIRAGLKAHKNEVDEINLSL